jgi:hypothetical protein
MTSYLTYILTYHPEVCVYIYIFIYWIYILNYSDVLFDIFGIYSDSLSGILSGIYSDILSDMATDIWSS